MEGKNVSDELGRGVREGTGKCAEVEQGNCDRIQEDSGGKEKDELVYAGRWQVSVLEFL